MTDRCVFDTEAIIAYLYDEPGKDVVAEYLTGVRNGALSGLLTETNAAEVFYLVARFEGVDDKPTADSLRTADRDIRALERWGLQIEPANWRVAAEVKADGHISIADAHAVALAAETDATLLVGADDDFDELPVNVDVTRFRNNRV
ncbi:type II toxin-antitoxin system VapC family toxin [Natronococcus sp. JC468]|uniref:PIN domain-containing protein n=1 Tax=Natronococcus sp. JC468 TaxID=1961921 RepID=UPI00143AFB7C|nr:PIN domain-containing protein [Natronococcus sp. JC468]NKE37900.1 type II toxin-antitoxin system VapC family toxin [Natronococcus sp. JC468]